MSPRGERRPSSRAGWLVLLHQLPARPSAARVAAWRRLQALGAVQLKNAAYVLPATPETREDFEWLRSEIVAGGGEATVLETAALPRDETSAVLSALAAARAREYRLLLRSIEAFGRAQARRSRIDRREVERALRGFRDQSSRIVRRTFFASPGRAPVERALAGLERLLRPSAGSPARVVDRAAYRGRRWVTRPRPGIDRMASAWLIRRFIDSRARFEFAGERSPIPDGAVRFDTFGGDFTHEGGLCTVEVLAQRFGLQDRAVRVIGEIVHDADLKEHRYGRHETATVVQLVDGLRSGYADDGALLEQGARMFEALYRSLEVPRRTRANRKGRH